MHNVVPTINQKISEANNSKTYLNLQIHGNIVYKSMGILFSIVLTPVVLKQYLKNVIATSYVTSSTKYDTGVQLSPQKVRIRV